MSDEDELQQLNAALPKKQSGDDAELAALNAQLPKAQVSAGADFAKSIPTGLVKGLSAAQSAAGNAAMLEMGQLPDESTSPAETTKQYEKTFTGPLYQPQGFTGRVGQGIGEVLGNPASYVGPGGLGVKLVTGAGAGAGSEALGGLGKAFGGPGGELAGRVAGGFLGGAGSLAGAKGIGKVGEALAPGITSEETGAIVAPGAGSTGGPTIPTNPLAGYDPMAVNKLAKYTQQSEMTPADIAQRFGYLGPEGFLAEGSRPLLASASGLTNDIGPGMQTLYNAFEGRMDTRTARLEQAVTDAMGPRENIPALTAQREAATKTAVDPLYNQFRNTTIPMTPDLEALLPRLQSTGATASAAQKMAWAGKPAGPTAETWDYMKRALDDKISVAIRGGANDDARLLTGLKNDLLDAIDNHPDPNVAGVWKAARQAYAGPAAIQNAQDAGQAIFRPTTHPDQFAIDWARLSAPEKQAQLQSARSVVADTMDRTSRGDPNAINLILAPASQAKLRTMIGPDKTEALVHAAQREQDFAANRTMVSQGSMTSLRGQAQKEFATPESPLTGPGIYMPGVSSQPFTFIPGKAHQAYMNWRYPNMRSSAAQMLTTQGPTAQDLMQALLAHQIPQNPLVQGAGYAAAPAIINALRGQP